MNALAELLDAVRERSGLPSDMALATKLGIQRQTLHQARKGVAGLSDERIAQLCELGKLDGAVWLAKIHAERATSPVERRVWRSVLDRLSAAAAVLVLVVLAAPGVARAKAFEIKGLEQGNAAVCILCSKHPRGRWRTVRLNPLAAWQLRLPPSSDQGLMHAPGDPAADQADPPRQ
ncbi:hypothetical protein GT799_02755 [Stenotrophomonas maltophilia]|uniref:DUF3693 domain-containing protein n=1 Tax=Stenotrophomonas maltophilia TaxID=40324 RepID=UPI001F1FF656|nr:DUF3693 domain-containing protein [Stenotrophomonas maltophilia]MCF3458656.1 hypothetical protein [Stenotrophomonas maltophilia]MCF3515134.1 hypothetical protein [Stenotrophomonas maltophilia]